LLTSLVVKNICANVYNTLAHTYMYIDRDSKSRQIDKL